MKTKLIALLVGLIPVIALAQQLEEDDMYFNAADRKALAAAKPLPKVYGNDTNEANDELNSTGSYSGRGQNPQANSKGNQDAYFTPDYTPKGVNQNNQYTNGGNNFCDKNYYGSSYYNRMGMNPYNSMLYSPSAALWNSPYGGGYGTYGMGYSPYNSYYGSPYGMGYSPYNSYYGSPYGNSLYYNPYYSNPNAYYNRYYAPVEQKRSVNARVYESNPSPANARQSYTNGRSQEDARVSDDRSSRQISTPAQPPRSNWDNFGGSGRMPGGSGGGFGGGGFGSGGSSGSRSGGGGR